MDLLTHGLAGAALALALARPRDARAAAGAGAIAGMLPDADILIGATADPLLAIEYHRHFTHALVFVPVGALLTALLLWPLLRRILPFGQLYCYALAGCATAGLLDACTSYGTQLGWPFTNERFAWSIVAVVDPAVTLAIATGLAVALWRRRPALAGAGLAVAVCYLTLGLVQHGRVESSALALARERGHHPTQLLVKPTLANLVLWRSTYLHGGRIHADAIRAGLFGGLWVYPGESAPLVEPAVDLAWAPPGSLAQQQAGRFARLSDGYLAWHPLRPAMLGDARYAMLPTSIAPLWGLAFDMKEPASAPALVTERTMTEADRRRFVDMLLGR